MRIRRSEEVRLVFEYKRSVADDVLIVYARPSGRGHGRLGLSVSKRVGNAVVRNQWKRWIREAYRLQRIWNIADLDVVIVPRGGDLPGQERIGKSVVALVQRIARRLRRDEPGHPDLG